MSDLKPCPKCGQAPRLITNIFGYFYVACTDLETRCCATADEAAKLWNDGKYEEAP